MAGRKKPGPSRDPLKVRLLRILLVSSSSGVNPATEDLCNILDIDRRHLSIISREASELLETQGGGVKLIVQRQATYSLEGDLDVVKALTMPEEERLAIILGHLKGEPRGTETDEGR